MRTIVVTVVIVIIGLFASVGPAIPVRAQVYTPPALTAVTGPCPQVSGLQTAPWPYAYSVCTYSGGRANVTVPGGLTVRWRYYVTSWWWPFPQEVTQLAYSGQTVQTDWFEVYYSYFPYGYAPGVPIYQPPYTPPGAPIYQPPPVVVSPPYTPPGQAPWPSPMPGLPAPGTPAPRETRTGVGLTLGFALGWPLAGYRIQYASGRTFFQCYTQVTPEGGWLTDGIINPNDGVARHAPYPCPYP